MVHNHGEYIRPLRRVVPENEGLEILHSPGALASKDLFKFRSFRKFLIFNPPGPKPPGSKTLLKLVVEPTHLKEMHCQKWIISPSFGVNINNIWSSIAYLRSSYVGSQSHPPP